MTGVRFSNTMSTTSSSFTVFCRNAVLMPGRGVGGEEGEGEEG